VQFVAKCPPEKQERLHPNQYPTVTGLQSSQALGSPGLFSFNVSLGDEQFGVEDGPTGRAAQRVVGDADQTQIQEWALLHAPARARP